MKHENIGLLDYESGQGLPWKLECYFHTHYHKYPHIVWRIRLPQIPYRNILEGSTLLRAFPELAVAKDMLLTGPSSMGRSGAAIGEPEG